MALRRRRLRAKASPDASHGRQSPRFRRLTTSHRCRCGGELNAVERQRWDEAEPRTASVHGSGAAASDSPSGCRQPGRLYQLVGARWRRSIPLAARLRAEAVAAKQRATAEFAASQPAQRPPGRSYGCDRLYRRLQRQAVPCGGPRCTFCVCCALRRVLCFGTVSSMTDWSALAS